ncbi:lipooligosaccharide transport system permease protein [Rhizobium pisi]|jgi:lipooligosaccharide transport system permease protein|uniref:Nodulation protein J n=3 Tax=Rhizobium TaxID=379 RepID=A0A7W5BRH9_9HYPH|nr:MULTISPECIES: ABC transporter permease [Rhizobium]MBB3136723.1 lipooligosaccharide transport system permease protein [Rhizobium pisi]MBY2919329.1 ABC transporter permease [Rhizobium leguminosarum]MBY2974978.1 ABC transporter permease [Rhizobium leguminosarum]MBY2982518.1 ABC transporter permease [Rhizobium leguminosarum]MBY2989624.1 ABC transporter permease [Rhizobium leguminosarum]
MSVATLPAGGLNWLAVWRRNYLAWKKAALASILGNLADPIIYLFGLGAGLGVMVGHVDGVSYTAFLAAGMIATSAMTAATFETIYAAFGRMQGQRTWEAMLYTQLRLGDIVVGEMAWAATKASLAGTGIGIVAAMLGYTHWLSLLYALPVIALTGFAFASLGMVVTALAPSYDYFIFYQTLVITPMLFLSGAVFPIDQLPVAFQQLAAFLPLAHAVDVIRPTMLGQPITNVCLHIGVLCIYIVVPFFLSTALLRRRLMR